MVYPSVKPQKSYRLGRWILSIILTLAVLSVGFGTLVGWMLTHPQRQPIVGSPAKWGMPYHSVRFLSRQGHYRLHGWWIPATHPAGLTVVFAHGYASNREESGIPLLAIAKAVHQMGANVLMFDFRGEGRSPGSLVSVGYFEQWDLLGAVDYAHQLNPKNPIVLMGYSMGASTAILTAARSAWVSGVLADSPFANLKTYLEQHLSVWTHLPSFPFNAIILTILPYLTHIHPSQVNPLGVINKLGHRPILLIAGTQDTTIPDSNAISLYRKVRPEDPASTLWLVSGANHVQAFKVSPMLYLSHVYQLLHRLDSKIARPPTALGF